MYASDFFSGILLSQLRARTDSLASHLSLANSTGRFLLKTPSNFRVTPVPFAVFLLPPLSDASLCTPLELGLSSAILMRFVSPP